MIEKDFATFLASAKATVSLQKEKIITVNREFFHSDPLKPPNQ